MKSNSKKISICLIIFLTAVFTTGCNKVTNSVVVKTESVYDKVMGGSSSQDNQVSYNNNVIYLGDTPRSSQKFGPNDVSFNFYDLKR